VSGIGGDENGKRDRTAAGRSASSSADTFHSPAVARSFEGFYVYVCAALLLKFSPRLKGMAFQDLVQFLQKLPTREWSIKDVEELLSQAFVYKSLFEAAPSHLNG
jgi:hypothetical protein